MPKQELSEHDRQMIAVAENGHPSDPSENIDKSKVPEGEPEGEPEEPASTEFTLPEGYASFDELVAAAKRGKDSTEEKPDGESTEEDTAEDKEQPSEEQEESDTLSGAELELREIRVYESVGGKEQYKEITKYAAANCSEEELDVYNAAVNGTDPTIAMFATRALQAMHAQHASKTHGTQGQMTLPDGNSSVPVASTGFANQSEMMKAMSDQRYRTDPVFNAQVSKRVALSTF